MSILIHRQIHGYRSGHQLLQSTVSLDRKDQEAIDHLSDMAGPLRPGEIFQPYICAYPTPTQEYFVLSRTDQDLDAPRAGCVTTRSLLIPTDYWAAEADPVYLGDILWRDWDEKPLKMEGPERAPASPAVASDALLPLVEALFLERRSPIVLFGASQSREIALRLLSAFWPSMRRSFSICTFALSPRYIHGKPFDLLFAPPDAKLRFSDWKGRRFEVGPKPSEARHRWTQEVANKIFATAHPSLLGDDSIGALAADSTGDEGALRLTLLWDELLQQVAVSPGAALGLLDIARSRGVESATWPIVEPSLTKALQIVPSAISPTEAWALISALLGKLRPEQLTPNVANALARAALELTGRDWKAALVYAARAPYAVAADRVALRAICAGLSKVESAELEEALAGLPSGRLLQMLLLDDSLRRRVLASSGAFWPSILASVALAVEEATVEVRRSATNILLPFITGDSGIALLAELLRDASASEVQSVADRVWDIETARGIGIGSVLCDAAVRTHTEASVREILVRRGFDVPTRQTVRRLIDSTPGDIAWLFSTSSLQGVRSELLEYLVDKSGIDQVVDAIGASQCGTQVVDALVSEGNVGFAAKLAPLVVSQCEVLGDFSKAIYPQLNAQDKAEFAEAFISRVARQAPINDIHTMKEAIELLCSDRSPASLLTSISSLRLDGGRLSYVYLSLVALASTLKAQFAAETWLLSKPIVDRKCLDLTNEGISAFSSLLTLSKTSGAPDFGWCAWRLLPFAMEARDRLASSLLFVIFPYAYGELRNSNRLGEMLGGLVFGDWDKCKVARKQLVRSFMRSSWPPGDLARLALEIGDVGRVFRRVLKEPGGANYLDRIEHELQFSADEIQSLIGQALKEARSWGSYIYDSDT